MLLTGKTALVTGAADGIGRAICQRAAQEGADIIVTDIDTLRGKELAYELSNIGRRAEFFHMDMGSVDSIRRAVPEALENFGQIDLLANNAGVTRARKIFEITEEDWDLQHSVNSKGAFFCLQTVAKHMAKRNCGRIVNVASIAAFGFRHTTSVAYSMSKAGVLVMTQTAAHLLKDYGINVNSVCPGPTYTDFSLGGVDEDRRKKLPAEIMYERMDTYVPLGRANTPEDVANVVIFLMSDLARNVTGSAYVIDGGIMLR